MLFHISLLLYVQFREQTFSQIERKLNSSFYVRYVDSFWLFLKITAMFTILLTE